MKFSNLFSALVVVVLGVSSLKADITSPPVLSGDFIKENKVLKGSWSGGKNFTPRACSRGFYIGRAKVKGLFENVKMELLDENVMDVYASIVDVYARVEGEYLGDYSACQNVSGWLGVLADRIEVQAKVTIPDSSDKVKIKVSLVKLGHLHFGNYVPKWFENLATDSLNQALVQIWKTCLGEWLNQRFSDYFNGLHGKRGI